MSLPVCITISSLKTPMGQKFIEFKDHANSEVIRQVIECYKMALSRVKCHMGYTSWINADWSAAAIGRSCSAIKQTLRVVVILVVVAVVVVVVDYSIIEPGIHGAIIKHTQQN